MGRTVVVGTDVVDPMNRRLLVETKSQSFSGGRDDRRLGTSWKIYV